MIKIKEAIKLSGVSVFFASLCCLSPLVLVIFGLSSVSFASSLSDNLYGNYKWIFRSVGLILLLISLILYFRRKKGICTIDEAKKRRQEIINTSLIVLISGVLGYIFFLYVVVHYIGVFFKLW
jgi:TctA family transporter